MKMVVIRPAKQQDREIITKISANAWETHGDYDYISLVIDEWLADRQGQLVVAEMQGQLVGCAKLSVIDDNVAWLEGLRVARNKQGLGIGKELQRYFTDQIDDFSAIRLSTFIGNEASLHIINKQGFSEMARFTVYEALATASEKSFEPIVQLVDADEVWHFIDHKTLFQSNNFVGCGWVFKQLNPRLLHKLLKSQSGYGIYSDGQLQALMLLSDHHCKECGYSINYLQYSSMEDANLLLEFAKHKSAAKSIKKVLTMCPDSPSLRKLFLSHQFYSYTEDINNVFVFELKHHRKG